MVVSRSIYAAVDDDVVVVVDRWWFGDVQAGEVLSLTVEAIVGVALTQLVADDEVEVSVVEPLDAVSVVPTTRRVRRISTVEFLLDYVCRTNYGHGSLCLHPTKPTLTNPTHPIVSTHADPPNQPIRS